MSKLTGIGSRDTAKAEKKEIARNKFITSLDKVAAGALIAAAPALGLVTGGVATAMVIGAAAVAGVGVVEIGQQTANKIAENRKNSPGARMRNY